MSRYPAADTPETVGFGPVRGLAVTGRAVAEWYGTPELGLPHLLGRPDGVAGALRARPRGRRPPLGRARGKDPGRPRGKGSAP